MLPEQSFQSRKFQRKLFSVVEGNPMQPSHTTPVLPLLWQTTAPRTDHFPPLHWIRIHIHDWKRTAPYQGSQQLYCLISWNPPELQYQLQYVHWLFSALANKDKQLLHTECKINVSLWNIQYFKFSKHVFTCSVLPLLQHVPTAATFKLSIFWPNPLVLTGYWLATCFLTKPRRTTFTAQFSLIADKAKLEHYEVCKSEYKIKTWKGQFIRTSTSGRQHELCYFPQKTGGCYSHNTERQRHTPRAPTSIYFGRSTVHSEDGSIY